MVKICIRKQKVKGYEYQQFSIFISKKDLKKLNWDTTKEVETSTKGNKFIVEPKQI